MKPLELSIKGLNSFEDEQIIDFTGLMRFGIFGVFGPTGSGKSSIFDAMTLALYGAMPRHGRDSFRECLNSSADEMAVRLRFEIFGGVYVAERRYCLKKDRLEPKLARLYREQTEVITDKAAHMTREVTELIGLGYSDFSRAVVLPQGRFAEFLLLENKEKRDMLERIFGLESYGEELNRRVNTARREQTTRLEVLDASLAVYGDVSAEKLAAERSALTAAEARLRELKAQAAQQTAVVKEYEEFGRLLTEREGCLEQLERLRAQESAQRERKARHRAAQSADIISLYISDYRRALDELNGCNTALDAKKEALTRCGAEEQAAAVGYDQAQKLKDTEYIELVTREARLVQAVGLCDELAGEAAEHKRLRMEYRKVLTALDGRKSAHAELLAAVERDAGLLDDVRRRRLEAAVSAEYRAKVQAAATAARELAALDKRIKSAEGSVERLLRRVSAGRAEQEALTTQAADCAGRVAAAERELTAEQKNMVHALALTLVPGQACPVCGSTEHPFAAKPLSAAKPLRAATSPEVAMTPGAQGGIDEKEQALTALRAEADELRIKAARLAAGVERDTEAINEQNEALAELLAAQAEPLARLAECGFDIPGADEAAKQLAERDVVCEELDKTEAQYRTAQDARRVELDGAAAAITKLGVELSALEAAGREKRGGIDRLRARIAELAGDEEKIEGSALKLPQGGTGSAPLFAADLCGASYDACAHLALTEPRTPFIRHRRQSSSVPLTPTKTARERGFEEQSSQENGQVSDRGSEISPEALAELLADVRDRARRIQSGLTSAKAALERLTARKRELLDECNGLTARIAALTEQQAALYSTITGLLREHGYTAMDEVQALSGAEKDKLAAEIGAYDRQLAACEDNITRLDAAIAPRLSDGAVPDAGRVSEQAERERAVLVALTDETEEIAQAAAVLKERAAKTESDLKEVNRLKEERCAAEHRLDLLTDLGKLFAGNQFVEYIAGRQMRYIASEASARLKDMTAGRYAVELTEHADFIIRDDHNGGARRSPRTLSGGETFIASLCLALALSSKIQLKGKSRLEFFFLDEGFGSLDPAALDMVVSALERLRQERMTVGVITHVEELKNRMPVKLLVAPAKPGVCGSKVRMEL